MRQNVNQKVLELIESGSSKDELYKLDFKKLGYNGNISSWKRFVRKYWALSGKPRGQAINGNPENSFKKEEQENAIHLELVSSDLKTLDDLISFAKIDTEIWEASKVVSNAWGSETNPCYQIKAWFIRKPVQVRREDLKSLIESYVPCQIVIPNHKKIKEEVLAVLSLSDHHFGQLSWAEETGEDFNLKLARDTYMNAILSFSQRLKDVDRVLYVIGNDFFNSDNGLNQTTAGTRQVEDTRWQKTFKEGVELLIDSIHYLTTYYPVDVLIVPGNHDSERIYYAGTVLEHKFGTNDTIHIDNTPRTRKYYSWGSVLLGFTHGSEESKDKLPLIMSREAKEAWGQSKFIEIHRGHLHKQKERIFTTVDEEMGIIERYLPSLTSRDDWHTKKGYGHMRESQCLLYDKELGNIGILKHTI